MALVAIQFVLVHRQKNERARATFRFGISSARIA
jgi:hypothetical protein